MKTNTCLEKVYTVGKMKEDTEKIKNSLAFDGGDFIGDIRITPCLYFDELVFEVAVSGVRKSHLTISGARRLARWLLDSTDGLDTKDHA